MNNFKITYFSNPPYLVSQIGNILESLFLIVLLRITKRVVLCQSLLKQRPYVIVKGD